MQSRLAEPLTRDLERIARRAQIDSRTPGLVAGVARDGAIAWSTAVGSADLDDPSVPLGDDTQFLVASNTKTFTAALVMQLRDEGKVDLDDRLDQHLPGVEHGAVTVRQLLIHGSGMQREPVGDVWDTLQFPDREGLVAGWNEAERIGRPHLVWHYSNLGYALLGELVARLDGREWEQSLQTRLLDPIGLKRSTLQLAAPHSGQYYVAPFTDVPVREPLLDKGATSAAGALCSTLGDMMRWHQFLLDPDDSVLRKDTVEEMTTPQLLVDGSWGGGWGLGFQLVRKDGRTWFGHTGGLPGGITGFFSHADSGVSAGVLMNATNAIEPDVTAVQLGSFVAQEDPAMPKPWMPGSTTPDGFTELTGRWFSEGSGFTFVIRDGQLQAKLDRAPDTAKWSVFEKLGDDVFRTIAGREKGERLVVRRDSNGAVRQMNWATYKFTREPLPFG
ncbi:MULTISPECIES: serine hydrolase domain-containing protein [unclassified Yimella]|uniref:serine hydrolase domain-containing protein n=1 Tax=unclassified Yimella TaxID=2649892 RepID=UPI00101B8FCA|nr:MULTISPECIES: serine hydrolase domain-containing protein [unclassified Yimella]MCG8656390.1 beta-lactamase family protein [Yimella sp. NH-Cas1]RYG78398.1 class A beta-lactamase-related serine hydrolase [Yimella sp. RIT 621]